MKKTMSVVAITAFAGLASAGGSGGLGTTITFDNLAVDAANPITFTIFQTDHGPLEGFKWDLTYSTVTPSWGAELNIVLTHLASGFSINFDGGEPNLGDTTPSDVLFGWGESSGTFFSSGSIAWSGPDDTFGEWQVFIFEDFDDFGTDGFLSGTLEINKVPAPSSLALLGLGGLAAARRRR